MDRNEREYEEVGGYMIKRKKPEEKKKTHRKGV